MHEAAFQLQWEKRRRKTVFSFLSPSTVFRRICEKSFPKGNSPYNYHNLLEAGGWTRGPCGLLPTLGFYN